MRAFANDPEEVRRKWREDKAAQRDALALKALEAVRGAPKLQKAAVGYSGALKPNGF